MFRRGRGVPPPFAGARGFGREPARRGGAGSAAGGAGGGPTDPPAAALLPDGTVDHHDLARRGGNGAAVPVGCGPYGPVSGSSATEFVLPEQAGSSEAAARDAAFGVGGECLRPHLCRRSTVLERRCGSECGVFGLGWDRGDGCARARASAKGGTREDGPGTAGSRTRTPAAPSRVTLRAPPRHGPDRLPRPIGRRAGSGSRARRRSRRSAGCGRCDTPFPPGAR